jgi:hypothetical protein
MLLSKFIDFAFHCLLFQFLNIHDIDCQSNGAEIKLCESSWLKQSCTGLVLRRCDLGRNLMKLWKSVPEKSSDGHLGGSKHGQSKFPMLSNDEQDI